MDLAGAGGGFSGDTSRDALRAQFDALRRISPARRLALMDDLTRMVQRLSREGLRRRPPGASEAELDDLFCILVHGPELAAPVIARRRARQGRSGP